VICNVGCAVGLVLTGIDTACFTVFSLPPTLPPLIYFIPSLLTFEGRCAEIINISMMEGLTPLATAADQGRHSMNRLRAHTQRT
jgi:hypothetical protein